ncbi:MAG: type II secretion system protein GspG [Sulfuricella sp.]|nr:type II secretion system protein GspG [Sulfuricella sp.]
MMRIRWRNISLIEALAVALPLAAAVATAAGIHLHRSDEHTLRLTRARDDLRALNSALLQRTPMPDTAQGLDALAKSGMLERIPLDPWGRPYRYLHPGTVRSYDLYSLGPDGVESQDDVVAWNLYGGR